MSQMKVGDPILWVGKVDGSDEIHEGTITRIGGPKDMPPVWVDHQHRPEDCIYMAHCWPARVKYDLEAILKVRRELKKQFDDSMKLVYELRNAIVRGER